MCDTIVNHVILQPRNSPAFLIIGTILRFDEVSNSTCDASVYYGDRLKGNRFMKATATTGSWGHECILAI